MNESGTLGPFSERRDDLEEEGPKGLPTPLPDTPGLSIHVPGRTKHYRRSTNRPSTLRARDIYTGKVENPDVREPNKRTNPWTSFQGHLGPKTVTNYRLLQTKEFLNRPTEKGNRQGRHGGH